MALIIIEDKLIIQASSGEPAGKDWSRAEAQRRPG